MRSISSNSSEESDRDPLSLLQELLDQARTQTKILSEIKVDTELDVCLLDKIGRIVCINANETHKNAQLLTTIRDSLNLLLEIYKSVHPEQALQLDKIAKLRDELHKCCPPEEHIDLVCKYEPCEPNGGIRRGDGYSMKSRGFVNAVQVSEEHEQWEIQPRTLNDIEDLPQVPQGPLVGLLIPVAPTPHVLDFRSGGGTPPGGQAPVTFRTFSENGVTTGIWPPDMSGAKGGNVVVMSGNLWLKLSVDSGKTFSDVKFTDVFAADNTYGGWAGDQVIHYVPQIDCFVLYVQSNVGAQGSANPSKNVIKVALANPADLKKFSGGRQAWRRQWDFTSDDFGLNAWLDFPDVSYGNAFLYINTNTFTRTYDAAGKPSDAFQGKLFFELPLKELQAGIGFNYYYALCSDNLVYGSPTQNIGDENYWAAHINNATIRIYSSKGSDANYFWRERKLAASHGHHQHCARFWRLDQRRPSHHWCNPGQQPALVCLVGCEGQGCRRCRRVRFSTATHPDRQVRFNAGLQIHRADPGMER
jgi:hypothetical protein